MTVAWADLAGRARAAARTAGGLSGLQWAALAKAVGWVPLTRVALLVVPWRRLAAAFDAAPVRGAPDMERARAAVWAVGAISRRALRDRPCLTQAPAARHLLRRCGVETTLEIGATRGSDGAVLAHAWLERDGQVVIGGVESPSTYARFRPANQQRGDQAQAQSGAPSNSPARS